MSQERLCRPIAFLHPDLTVAYSAWNGLIPFAFWITDALKPRVLVELGTETGVSYCAFCQAVRYLELETACYAVDTWQGDAHTGPYGPEVFRRLTDYHQPRYGGFSRLVRTTFDEAAKQFSDGSVDLLHIDGYHTYDIVKHDFQTWLPKLSERGVILFHDINVRNMDFGVWRFWEEIKQRYPSFSLLHSSGLGVLGVGSRLPDAIHWLTDGCGNDAGQIELIRSFFVSLGAEASSIAEKKELETRLSELQLQMAKRDEEIKSLVALVEERYKSVKTLDETTRRLSAQLQEREKQIGAYVTSRSWRITRPLRAVTGAVSKIARAGKPQDPCLQELLYNIESFKASGLNILVIGWVFHRDQAISSIKLVARSGDSIEGFEACYGIARKDVAKAQPFPNALASGFRLSAMMLSEKDSFSLQVQIQGRTGSPLEIKMTPQIVEWQDLVLGGLAYAIDIAKIRGSRLRVTGWVLHEQVNISSLQLIAQTQTSIQEFDVSYGIRREDIRNSHPFARGSRSSGFGFAVSGTLPSEELPQLRLRVRFLGEEGRPIEIAISPDKVDTTPGDSPVTFKELISLVRRETSNGAEYPVNVTTTEVREFLDSASASLGNGPQFTLIIDHNLGGGATRYRDKLIQDIRRKKKPILLLYYDLPKLEYVIDCFLLNQSLRVYPDSPVDLLDFAGAIGLEEIFLNNIYAYDDYLSMATLLRDLKRATGARLTIAIHDFLTICPSIHLLDDQGAFCDVPDISRCEQCLPRNRTAPSLLINHKDITTWRSAWRQCFVEAESILCFSESSRQLVQRAYPEIDPDKFLTRPHTVDYRPSRTPATDPWGMLTIGVVGHINSAKGAGIVTQLAGCIRRRHLAAKIVVIGTLDQEEPNDIITVTGPYETNDLPDLIEQNGVNLFLLPSIVPETFSYVAQELMMLGVPLAVFNLGAPPERVATYAKGLILHAVDAEATLDALIAFQEALRQDSTTVVDLKNPHRAPVAVNDGAESRKLHAFTCAAVNYLPKVRLLCKSIKQYHPEMKIHLALADKLPAWLDICKEPFDEVVSVETLKIPNKTGWIFGHTLVELSTAIKPFMLQRLLEVESCDQVFYFDPDIVLFSRLDELISTLDTASIVLTPHLTKPESTIDAIRDNEICSMKHGIFNLGFIGVRNVDEGRAFAKWWADRLYYFCQEAIEQGLFTDQKWIDLVPAFFEGVYIVKSPRFNVAPWNLSTRNITGSFDKGFTVNSEPLGFYHFTGFDSGAHKVMATKYANGNTAVSSLVDWYTTITARDADSRRTRNSPWAYSRFGNGELITRNHRFIYRLRQDLQRAFPDPFEVRAGKDSYYDWFKHQAPIEYPELLLSESTASEV